MSLNGLGKLGLFFDEFNKITIWEPEAADRTFSLKTECKDFADKTAAFHSVTKEFIGLLCNLADHVEREKIKALGSSNLLKSMTKQRESQQQLYQSLIIEKSTELERLRMQHQSLMKIQLEQQETAVDDYEIRAKYRKDAPIFRNYRTKGR